MLCCFANFERFWTPWATFAARSSNCWKTGNWVFVDFGRNKSVQRFSCRRKAYRRAHTVWLFLYAENWAQAVDLTSSYLPFARSQTDNLSHRLWSSAIGSPAERWKADPQNTSLGCLLTLPWTARHERESGLLLVFFLSSLFEEAKTWLGRDTRRFFQNFADHQKPVVGALHWCKQWILNHFGSCTVTVTVTQLFSQSKVQSENLLSVEDLCCFAETFFWSSVLAKCWLHRFCAVTNPPRLNCTFPLCQLCVRTTVRKKNWSTSRWTKLKYILNQRALSKQDTSPCRDPTGLKTWGKLLKWVPCVHQSHSRKLTIFSKSPNTLSWELCSMKLPSVCLEPEETHCTWWQFMPNKYDIKKSEMLDKSKWMIHTAKGILPLSLPLCLMCCTQLLHTTAAPSAGVLGLCCTRLGTPFLSSGHLASHCRRKWKQPLVCPTFWRFWKAWTFFQLIVPPCSRKWQPIITKENLMTGSDPVLTCLKRSCPRSKTSQWNHSSWFAWYSSCNEPAFEYLRADYLQFEDNLIKTTSWNQSEVQKKDVRVSQGPLLQMSTHVQSHTLCQLFLCKYEGVVDTNVPSIQNSDQLGHFTSHAGTR